MNVRSIFIDVHASMETLLIFDELPTYGKFQFIYTIVRLFYKLILRSFTLQLLSLFIKTSY